MKDRASTARTITGSIGIGLLAVMMAGVVAFGANSIRPLTANRDAEATAAPTEKPRAEEPAATPKPEPTTKEAAFTGGDEGTFREEPREPTAAPTEKAEPDATPKPEPKPDAEPTKKPDATEKPKPVSDHLELEAWVKEGRVKLAWSKYNGDGFSYYKVVRSTDATVTWPLGEGDALVAAIADQWSPYAVDKPACGKEFHYRVFAVRATEEGYKVIAASNVDGAYIECAPEPTAPPAPQAMGFDAAQGEGGYVRLAWDACTADGFLYYKVVRSRVNEAPTYPLHDGDELLAAIGDRSQTVYEDGAVEAGQTWFYRILCFGDGGTLLGKTAAKAVAVE